MCTFAPDFNHIKDNEKDFCTIILNHRRAFSYGSERTRSYEVFRKINN